MYFFVHHNSSGEHHLPPVNTAASIKSCKAFRKPSIDRFSPLEIMRTSLKNN